MAQVLDTYIIEGNRYTLMGFKKNRSVAIMSDGKKNYEFDLTKEQFVGEKPVEAKEKTVEKAVEKTSDTQAYSQCSDCKRKLPLSEFAKFKGGTLRKQCQTCFGVRISEGRKSAKAKASKEMKPNEPIESTTEMSLEEEMNRHQEKAMVVAKRLAEGFKAGLNQPSSEVIKAVKLPITSRFKEITTEMSDLYERKNADYGNSFANSLDEFGIIAGIVRLSDKMSRVKALTKNDKQLVLDESLKDTLRDLANYSIMTLMWLEENEGGKVNE